MEPKVGIGYVSKAEETTEAVILAYSNKTLKQRKRQVEVYNIFHAELENWHKKKLTIRLKKNLISVLPGVTISFNRDKTWKHTVTIQFWESGAMNFESGFRFEFDGDLPLNIYDFDDRYKYYGVGIHKYIEHIEKVIKNIHSNVDKYNNKVRAFNKARKALETATENLG